MVEAALDSGVVAGETVELGGEVFVLEDFGGGPRCGELSFHTANAVEVPSGDGEFVEDDALERALRLDFGLELCAQVFELLAFSDGDDSLCGAEAMRARVLGGTCLALFGARPGAALRVGGVGDLPGWRRHVSLVLLRIWFRR